MEEDCYTTAQVSNRASYARIKRAYQRLAVQCCATLNGFETLELRLSRKLLDHAVPSADAVSNVTCNAIKHKTQPVRAVTVLHNENTENLDCYSLPNQPHTCRPWSLDRGNTTKKRTSEIQVLSTSSAEAQTTTAPSTTMTYEANSQPKPLFSERPNYVELGSLKPCSTKRMRVTRQRECPSGGGSRKERETFLCIRVSPTYCSKNMRLFYPNEGDLHVGTESMDILHETNKNEHTLFKRAGDDLYSRITIGIRLALLGGQVMINGLNGDILTIPVPQNTATGDQYRIIGAGIPLSLSKSKRPADAHGDLVIVFHVSMPDAPLPREVLQQLGTLLPTFTPRQSSA
ncbi:hypothetical protein EG68_00221 [Paragonimus skrjabini miyazakii]|uniref:Chaperone DnaJ C-terminal domain-containing protein n=1 Tax=Paragonimus skrjabini miyazakii TaxID=59628 RepID=A0A8S9Z9G7_9TREM|nr:hypothetical protein EG68_00221 [Paragonimus skrjabini miyazakii]